MTCGITVLVSRVYISFSYHPEFLPPPGGGRGCRAGGGMRDAAMHGEGLTAVIRRSLDATVRSTYRFRLWPAKRPEAALSACLEDTRQPCNAALEERREASR